MVALIRCFISNIFTFRHINFVCIVCIPWTILFTTKVLNGDLLVKEYFRWHRNEWVITISHLPAWCIMWITGFKIIYIPSNHNLNTEYWFNWRYVIQTNRKYYNKVNYSVDWLPHRFPQNNTFFTIGFRFQKVVSFCVLNAMLKPPC